MKLFFLIIISQILFATVPDHDWTGTLKQCANLALKKDLEHNLTKEELETIKEFKCNYYGEIYFDAIRDLKYVEVLEMRGNYIVQDVTYINEETNVTVSAGVRGASLPTWIGELQSLRVLNLSGNMMRGNIPAEIGTLVNLEKLDLSVNKFTKLPSSIGDLNASLKELHLASCGLVQLLPKELGNLSSLTHLYLQDNRLHGEIPAEFGNLQNLKKLRLNQNNLHGTIPVELVNLNLSQPNGLGLHENCNLKTDDNATLAWIESKSSLYRGYGGVRETGGHCGTPAVMTSIIMYLLSDSNTTQ